MTHINAAAGKSAYAFDRLAPRPAKKTGGPGYWAVANSHSCMGRDLAECDKLSIPRDEVLVALGVCLMVNHGAEHATRRYTDEFVGKIATESAT